MSRRHIIILFALPLILTCLDPGWLFTPEGYIDPWIYTGYLRRPATWIRHYFPHRYYSTRLSFILPGALCHAALPPIAAHVAFHLTLTYASLISLYYIVRRLATPTAALWSALLMGINGNFLTSMAWDYPDGMGIAYILCALALIVRTKDSPRAWVWLAAAGVLLAGAFYCNVAWLPFIGVAFLYSLYFLRRKMPPLRSAMSMALGILLCTLLLARAYSFINPFDRMWFYLPSIHLAMRIRDYDSPAGWAWFSSSKYLLWPSVIAASSLVALIWARRDALFFAPACILSYVGWMTLGWVGCTPNTFPNYASMLIPFGCIAFGLCWLARPRLRWVGLALMLICAAHSLCYMKSCWPVTPSRRFGSLGYTVGLYRRTIALMDATREHEPKLPIKPHFWYDLTEPNGMEYRSMTSTYLWAISLLNETFPYATMERLKFYNERDRVVILTERSDALELAQRTFRRAGLTLQPLHSMTLPGIGGTYHILICQPQLAEEEQDPQ